MTDDPAIPDLELAGAYVSATLGPTGDAYVLLTLETLKLGDTNPANAQPLPMVAMPAEVAIGLANAILATAKAGVIESTTYRRRN